MSIVSPGSPGTASDFAGNNMNTWDVARAINDNHNTNNNHHQLSGGSSTILSTAAAAALFLSYASSSSSSSSTPEGDSRRPTPIDRNSFRDTVIDVATDKGRLVLCASNCACDGSCEDTSSKELDRLKTEEVEEEEMSDSSTELDSSDTSVWDSTSTREAYDMTEVEAGQLLFGYGALSAFDSAFNSTFNDSLDWNNSLYNETYILEGLYPSGYGLFHIIIASIIVTVLMIVIVIGNMLVIIAIATEKALKNIQNWFIASLAVADFFLGLVIMPFSLANEIMGYWIFGYWWCDIHSAMDVLLCTASIMNLCLISLDRYWSITQAVEYLKKRTPARAALMIAMVWVLSAVICIPPLLGWKRAAPEEEYPKCKVSTIDRTFNY